MQKVKVEKWGGIEVSRLGYGCMRFPMKDGRIDTEASREMVDVAYNRGVNYFDTAYVYLGEQSEGFIGEALSKYPRDSYYIATKLPVWMVKQEDDVDSLFDEQLRRLGMDVIDFYLLHSLNGPGWNDVKRLKMVEKAAEKKRQGKIKFLGFSYHGDFESFKNIVDFYPWDFVQIQINYADYDMIGAKDFYDLLLEKDIPCIVMEPIRGGFLANPTKEVSEVMAELDASVSPASWALRWCIDLDNVPVILSGMNALIQVEENLETFEYNHKLNSAQKEMFERCVDILKSVKSIPCTGCNYCMDCPYGVDIPEIFNIYNVYQVFKSSFRANANYEDLVDRGGGADKCVKCGVCEARCPQGIEIPKKLEETHDFLLKVNG